MKPSEYEKNAIVTESKDFSAIQSRIDDKMIRLLHANIGMTSEISELTQAAYLVDSKNIDWVNVAEEVSDLAWYTAIAVNALGLDHNIISEGEASATTDGLLSKRSPHSLKEAIAALSLSVGIFSDAIKKHLFYGKPLEEANVKKCLEVICVTLSALSFVSETTIEEVRDKNIAKLKARYGDKFTEAAALNRDLETERKILEGKTE